MTAPAIETWYGGRLHRSRLEARWAVFFKHLDIDAHYEHQGFMVGGRPYLPDFYLPSSSTWVEVKGAESDLDCRLMEVAAATLPGNGSPNLLILGPIPEPPESDNWAWMGLDAPPGGDEDYAIDSWWQFGVCGLESARETSSAPPMSGEMPWLKPMANMGGGTPARVISAYRAAGSARFEHGESGPA